MTDVLLRPARVLLVGARAAVTGLEGTLRAAGYSVWTARLRQMNDDRIVSLANPDVAIVHLPKRLVSESLSATERISRFFGCPIVLHSEVWDPRLTSWLAELSVAGFVASPVSEAQLLGTVEVALQSRTTAVGAHRSSTQHEGAAEVLRSIVSVLDQAGWVALPQHPDEAADLSSLTKRERDVLDTFVRLRRVADVAVSLRISKHTVRNHLKAIYGKLGVHSQPELMVKVLGGGS